MSIKKKKNRIYVFLIYLKTYNNNLYDKMKNVTLYF